MSEAAPQTGAVTQTEPETEFDDLDVDAPLRRDHHGLEVRHARDGEGGRGPHREGHPLRDPRDVRPPRPRHGRRLLPQRAHARAAGDHRRRRPVGRAARRGRRAQRPAGHRRPALEPPERHGRPRRDPLDRADAARRARSPASASTTRATPATWPRASSARSRSATSTSRRTRRRAGRGRRSTCSDQACLHRLTLVVRRTRVALTVAGMSRAGTTPKDGRALDPLAPLPAVAVGCDGPVDCAVSRIDRGRHDARRHESTGPTRRPAAGPATPAARAAPPSCSRVVRRRTPASRAGCDLDNDGLVVPRRATAPTRSASARSRRSSAWSALALPDRHRHGAHVPALHVEGHARRPAARRPGHRRAADWYSPDELGVCRLSSKSHWDVPIEVGRRACTSWLAIRRRRSSTARGPQRHAQPRRDPLLGRLRQRRPRSGYIYDDAGATAACARTHVRDRRRHERRPVDGDSTAGAVSGCSTTRASTRRTLSRRPEQSARQDQITRRTGNPAVRTPTSPTCPRAGDRAPTTCCPLAPRGSPPSGSGRGRATALPLVGPSSPALLPNGNGSRRRPRRRRRRGGAPHDR